MKRSWNNVNLFWAMLFTPSQASSLVLEEKQQKINFATSWGLMITFSDVLECIDQVKLDFYHKLQTVFVFFEVLNRPHWTFFLEFCGKKHVKVVANSLEKSSWGKAEISIVFVWTLMCLLIWAQVFCFLTYDLFFLSKFKSWQHFGIVAQEKNTHFFAPHIFFQTFFN